MTLPQPSRTIVVEPVEAAEPAPAPAEAPPAAEEEAPAPTAPELVPSA